MEIWDKEWEAEVRRAIIGGWVFAVSSLSLFSFPMDFSCVSSPVLGANEMLFRFRIEG